MVQYKEFYSEVCRVAESIANVLSSKDSYYYKAFGQRRADILSRLIDPLPDEKILDIGCGSGNMLLSLNNSSSTRVGLDISSYNIRRASTNTQEVDSIYFIIGDAQSLPFRDEQYDKVLCSHMIEHLPDSQLLLGEVYRVLKSGGSFVCLTPNVSCAGHSPRLKPVVKPLFIAFSTTIALATLPFIKGKRSLIGKIKEVRKLGQEYKRIGKRFGLKEHVHEFTVLELASLLKDSGFHVNNVLLVGLHSGMRPIANISLYINDIYGRLWNGLAVFLEKRSSMRLKEGLLRDIIIVSEKE